MTAPRVRCSTLAREAGDRLAGTTAPARQWLLVEHPGPWGRAGYLQAGIDPDAVAALSAWSRRVSGRVLLIRRHGRDAVTGPRRWFRVDSRPGSESVRTGTAEREHDLVTAPDDPGDPHPDPIFLTCAHGRHDPCCAMRGRPVAAALAAAAPGASWECSHLGGCRFAPAVVLLPHGFVLGALEPADVPAVLEIYRSGTVPAHWLRGRASLPPAVQVAQHVARTRTGAVGVDQLGLLEVHATAEAAPGAEGPDWTVRLTDPPCTVRLREHWSPVDRPLTCAATEPGRQRTFELLDLTTEEP